MTRLWAEGDPITVQLAGGDPVQFRWQGRHHRVQRIWQRWRVDTDWWSEQGRVHRRCWAVTTEAGLFCVLCHDLVRQAWLLVRLYD